MRNLKPLQLTLCVAFGLMTASVYAGPPGGGSGDGWVPITYNPPEAAQQSNCGSGYYTCLSTARLLDIIHPYCCLTWQTDPYNPYCEEYDIARVQCSSGGIRYSNFSKYNRYFDENCSGDNTCL